MRTRAVLALAWVVAVLLLLAVHVFLPQRSGVLALTQVLEPFIVVSGLIAAWIALIAPTRLSLVIVIAIVAVTVLRYGPTWISFPQSTGAPLLNVATWNIEVGLEHDARALAGLESVQADLVALEELQPAAATALAADPTLAARYPHRALAPDRSVLGVGLLSRFPILEQRSQTDPPYMRVLVELPDLPQPAAVYVVHPLPARAQTIVGLPVALDTVARDASLALIRRDIDADLAAGRPVLVMGDINTTEREPAYAHFSAGLFDAHLEAGSGPGLTWRPGRFAALPFGLLRIDYVFSTPDLAPISSSVDCRDLSDHCIVSAGLEIR